MDHSSVEKFQNQWWHS